MGEKELPKKGGRSTTTVQVSRNLDLIITNYATKHGIPKHEAADRIFQILYPEGSIPEHGPPIAPRVEEGVEGQEVVVGGVPVSSEPDVVSEELTKTVKDLRAVKTIEALSKGLSEPGDKPEKTDLPSWTEILNQKKMDYLFGGKEDQTKQIDAQALTETFNKSLQAQTEKFEKMFAEHAKADVEKERDFYKSKLEEREAEEKRAVEIAEALTPIQQDMNLLSQKLETLAQELKPESKQPPTSAELEAIRALGVNIKEALVEVGKGKGGTEADKLTEYLDSLGAVIDKVTEFAGKKGGESAGESDWKSSALSVFGEVATETLKTYKDIATSKPPEEEEVKEEQSQLSNQVIERRVYNYAMKKIAAGQLQLDPYKAGEDLGLSANQVWKAIQALQKRGALKPPQVKEGGREGTEPGAGEGEVEGA